MTDVIGELQRWMCPQHDAEFLESPPDSRIGLARNARPGNWPLNGLRHPPEPNLCGWYLWAGEELSKDPEFFESHHVSHLPDLLPAALPYLGLPPGWRFLIAENYEDVWYDAMLLKV